MQGALGPGRESNKWAIAHMRNAAVFANLFKQAGGEMYNGDYTKVGYNSPEGLDAAQFIHDLHHKYQVHRPHGDYFKEGWQAKLRLPQGRDWHVLRDQPLPNPELCRGHRRHGEHVRIATAQAEGCVRDLVRPGRADGEKTRRKSEDASWEVHKFMVAADQAAHYSAIEYFLPNRRSARETPEYQAALENAPPFKVFLEALDNYSFRPGPSRLLRTLRRHCIAAGRYRQDAEPQPSRTPSPRRPASSTCYWRSSTGSRQTGCRQNRCVRRTPGPRSTPADGAGAGLLYGGPRYCTELPGQRRPTRQPGGDC